MTAELRIGTLRLRGRRSDVRGLDAHGTVRALDLTAANNRRVLVIRQMNVTVNDPQAARQRLEELRRTAVRPALGEVDPRAEAVEFTDEAEALRCLSADVLRGRAAARWWWSGRLPAHTTTPTETLVALWTARPRWVPEVFSSWMSSQPQLAVEAVSLLPRATADRLLDAMLADYVPPAVHRTELRANASGPASHARTVASQPADALAPAPVPPARIAAVQRRVAQRLGPLAGERLAGPTYALLAAAVVLDEQPSWATTPEFLAWLDAERCGTLPTTLANTPDGPPMSPVEPEPPSPSAVTPMRPPRASPVAPPDGEDEPPWQQRPWAGGGPATETELATLLYAVNLVRWFDLTRLSARGTGWAVVEAVGRWLLRELPTGRRRVLETDPLLELLARLDGRPDDEPTPVRLGTAIRPVRRFLRTHDLPASTFTEPGTVFVSRTHVDVVLDIDQIDLAARASGLDRDPGWMPELGRVVLFHFEGGS